MQVLCDNEAVVAIINQGTSKDPEAMHLVRCLAFIMANWEFYLFASHVKGHTDTAADALSRNNVSLFRSVHPQAHPLPTPITVGLLDLLIVRKPDWLSPTWTELWSSIFPTA